MGCFFIQSIFGGQNNHFKIVVSLSSKKICKVLFFFVEFREVWNLPIRPRSELSKRVVKFFIMLERYATYWRVENIPRHQIVPNWIETSSAVMISNYSNFHTWFFDILPIWTCFSNIFFAKKVLSIVRSSWINQDFADKRAILMLSAASLNYFRNLFSVWQLHSELRILIGFNPSFRCYNYKLNYRKDSFIQTTVCMKKKPN